MVKKYLCLVFMVLTIQTLNSAEQLPTSSEKPFLSRENLENILENGFDPAIELDKNSTPWKFRNADFQLDFEVSRGMDEGNEDSSGSIKLQIPYVPNQNESPLIHHFFSSPTGGSVTDAIPVEPLTTYTFSAYIKTDGWPTPTMALKVDYWNITMVNGEEILRPRIKPLEIAASNSVVNQWEEVAVTFTTPEWAEYITLGGLLKYYVVPEPPAVPTDEFSVWVDDLSLTKGVSFEQQQTPKVPFSPNPVAGKYYTKVDALGNVERCIDGACEPYFPLCIYGTAARSDFADYSRQGFNCEMRASVDSTISLFADAKSDFNPDGMLSSLQMSNYTTLRAYDYISNPPIEDEQTYANLVNYIDPIVAAFSENLESIYTQGLDDHLLFYYWDNESLQLTHFELYERLADKIKELDTLHPIYMLQGQYSLARRYNNNNAYISDITGSYINSYIRCDSQKDSGGILRELQFDGLEDLDGQLQPVLCKPYEIGGTELRYYNQIPEGAAALTILDNLESQNQPVVMAQINYSTYKSFRAKAFASLAKGAKGIGMWRDNFDRNSNSDADKAELAYWWPDFPNIRREIMSLLPVIREPHWSDWNAQVQSGELDFGTRTYGGDGYLFIYNETDQQKTAELSFSDLTYLPYAVTDAAYGNVVAQFNNTGNVELTANPYSGRILRLEDNYKKLTAFDFDFSEPTLNLNAIESVSAVRGFGDADFSAGKFNRTGFECDLVSWSNPLNPKTIVANEMLSTGGAELTVSTTVQLKVDPINLTNPPAGTDNPRGQLLELVDNCLNGIEVVGLVSKGGTTLTEPRYSVSYDYPTNSLIATLFDGQRALKAYALLDNNSLNLNDGQNHDIEVVFTNAGEVHFKVDDVTVNITETPVLNDVIYDTTKIPNASNENATIANSLLELDGTGYLQIPASEAYDIGSEDFTLVMSVKLDQSSQQYQTLVSKRVGNTESGYTLDYITDTKQLRFRLSDDVTEILSTSASVEKLEDGYFHVIAVRLNRDDDIDFFVDGIQVGSQDISGLLNAVIENQSAIEIGASAGALQAKGQIANIQMFRAALTDEDMGQAIQASMNEAPPIPDTDGDGYKDNVDAFPNDPTEWADTDGDGVGDNSDAFPNDPTETTDSDGDGVGDNSDAFPNDSNETVDTDGDGIGDNSDMFPIDPTEWSDRDGDGIGDNSDPYPDGGICESALWFLWPPCWF